jgi:hypothetical protein
MSSEENKLQEPESLFPVDTTTDDDTPPHESEEKQEEEAKEEATPPQATPTLPPPPSYEYTIDGQATGDMLYDPWATVNMAAAASPAASGVQPSQKQWDGDGRYTRDRIAAFAGVVVVVALVFGGVAYAFTRPLSPTMAAQVMTTTQPRPPHVMATPTAKKPTIPTPAPKPTASAVPAAPVLATTTQQDLFNDRNNPAGSWGPSWQLSSTVQDTQAFSVPGGGLAEIHATNTVVGGFYTAIFNDSYSSSTQDITVTFNLQHYFEQQKNMGIVLRWQNGRNYYKAYINGQYLVILRSIGGQKTLLQVVQFAASDDVLYTLRFRVVDQTLMAKVWQANTPEPSTWFLTVKDGNFTAGKAGVRAQLTGGDIVQVTQFRVTTGG